MLPLEQAVERLRITRDRVGVEAVESLGRDWESMVVVADDGGAVLLREREQPGFDLAPITVGEHAEKDLVLHRRGRRVPVDVEVAGVLALGPAEQDVPPPRVQPPGGRHVVGDDVDDQSEVMRMRGLDEAIETLLAAEVGVDPRRVDYVIPVFAAWRGLQDGGQIDVRYPELRQVRDYGRRAGEGELARELQAAERARHHRHNAPYSGRCRPVRPWVACSLAEGRELVVRQRDLFGA